MPIKHLPNSIHILRARLRSLSRPSVWLSALGVALVLGVGWEYAKRLNSPTDVEAENEGEVEISEALGSEWQGEVSDEDAQIAADIDSSDVLRSLLAQQESPAPAPVPDSGQARERREHIDRLLELMAADYELPGSSSNSEDASETNIFANLSPFGSLGTSDEEETPSDRSARSNLFSATTSGNAADSPPNDSLTNFLQFDLDGASLPNLRTNDSQRSAETDETEEETAESRQDGGATGDRNASNSDRRQRATSAETLPPFATPAPFSTPDETSTGSTLPAFTGYPYNPNAIAPDSAGNSGNYNNPYALPSAGTPSTSPSNVPAPTYRRPTFGATPPTTAENVNPYGNFNGNNGNAYGTPTGNPFSVNSGTGLSGNGATTPSTTGTTPYAYPTAPPQQFSVPRTPPGRAIGNGEINTFANP
ncbi:hypothetical protein [Baaleninema simplex]|uniref:hypothetical protein n=1 Tax=Baaleninema simplex TaxID=2862350 RepID=UPI00036A548D|nr:hypothetical protein [Baaleninema simplex]